jgi:hypothetical protein
MLIVSYYVADLHTATSCGYRHELKNLEAQIKKLRQKKDVGKLADEVIAARDAAKSIRSTTEPVPGRPYLQSSRLSLASQIPAHQVSKTLLKKVPTLYNPSCTVLL